MENSLAMERRGTERRVSRRVSLRWPERRTGFDRREERPLLEALRDNAGTLIGVLVALNLLSLLDLALTSYELTLDAAEGNPVMRAAFAAGPLVVAGVKLGVMTLVTLGIWMLRRYRRVLELSLGALALYLALTLYHLVGLASLS